MASSDNPGSSHTSSGSSNPSTNASVVAISPCTTSFRYSLSIVENIFPPPGASWVSDHHITPKPRFAKFSMRDVTDDIKPRAADFTSSITSQHLSEFRSLYNIPQDHELILPRHHERVNTPSRVFCNV